MQNYKLVGNYLKVGNKFSNDISSFMITERKKVTDKKSKYFLLSLPNKQYISSLYSTEKPSFYELEYQGIRYTCRIYLNNVFIEVKNSKTKSRK